jgi:hypothetical protein
MSLQEYYRSDFRGDLLSMIAAGPRSEHRREIETVIQPRTIGAENSVVMGWSDSRRARFAACLFLTLLVDQVCYTYFAMHYKRFRQLTRYPKWKGECPGGCFTHIHPSLVFAAIGRSPGPMNRPDCFAYRALPSDTLGTMEREVHAFVRDHMPELGEAFWDFCDREVPLQIRLAMSESRPR